MSYELDCCGFNPWLRIIARTASSAVCSAPHTAEFETNLRKERQAEGIAAARARGVYKGRKPKIDAAVVNKLRYGEKLGPAQIARRLGIGRASVYRVLGKKAA
jgi:DNA invertase Pin-like site-specific DNA recombinase